MVIPYNAVSYTHLDVYKRQSIESTETESETTTVSDEDKLETEAVSYTHLDVYKRQAPAWFI